MPHHDINLTLLQTDILFRLDPCAPSDDMMIRKMFTRSIHRCCPGWTITEAANGETALHLVDSNNYDIIFVDQYMSSTEKQLLGSETVRALRARGLSSIIVGFSANDAWDLFREAGAGKLYLPLCILIHKCF